MTPSPTPAQIRADVKRGREPILTTAYWIAAVELILAIAAAAWLNIADVAEETYETLLEAAAGTAAAVAILAPIVTAAIARQWTYPSTRVENEFIDAETGIRNLEARG